MEEELEEEELTLEEQLAREELMEDDPSKAGKKTKISKGRKKTLKKMRKWFEREVLHLPEHSKIKK